MVECLPKIYGVNSYTKLEASVQIIKNRQGSLLVYLFFFFQIISIYLLNKLQLNFVLLSLTDNSKITRTHLAASGQLKNYTENYCPGSGGPCDLAERVRERCKTRFAFVCVPLQTFAINA